MSELVWKTAVELAALIKRGEVSSRRKCYRRTWSKSMP